MDFGCNLSDDIMLTVQMESHVQHRCLHDLQQLQIWLILLFLYASLTSEVQGGHYSRMYKNVSLKLSLFFRLKDISSVAVRVWLLPNQRKATSVH